MKKLILTSVFSFLLSATPAFATFGNEEGVCLPKKELAEFLEKEGGGQKFVGYGMAKIPLDGELAGFIINGILEFAMNEKGYWSMWLTRPSGFSCLVMNGENFAFTDKGKPL